MVKKTIIIEEGTEVSELLGIKKYEPPVTTRFSQGGKITSKKKMNPLFDKYVDIENIKYYPNTFIIEQNGENVPDEVVVVEKYHGTNARFAHLPRRTDTWYHKLWAKIFGGYEFCVGSRQVQQDITNSGRTWHQQTGKLNVNVYNEMFKRLNCKKWIPKDTIVYGEIIGKGIQDLEYGLNDIDFICIDVKVGGRYLAYDQFIQFCTEHNLKTPHVFYMGKWNQDCLNHRNGLTTYPGASHIREGVVVKARHERSTSQLGRVILKVISEDYLLRSNDDATEYH